jgi:hypothetical protein
VIRRVCTPGARRTKQGRPQHPLPSLGPYLSRLHSRTGTEALSVWQSGGGRNRIVARELVAGLLKRECIRSVMNDTYQLASAALAFVFAAVILVIGQLYIQNRSERTLFIPAPRSVANAIDRPVTRPDQQTIIKAR